MAFSRSPCFTFASSYFTTTSFFSLSDDTLCTPFTSLSADSVRAAQPPQFQPETLMVSVFSPANAAVATPSDRRHPAMRLFMGTPFEGETYGEQIDSSDQAGNRKVRRA